MEPRKPKIKRLTSIQVLRNNITKLHDAKQKLANISDLLQNEQKPNLLIHTREVTSLQPSHKVYSLPTVDIEFPKLTLSKKCVTTQSMQAFTETTTNFEQAYATRSSSRNSLVSESWDYNKYAISLHDPYACVSSSYSFVRQPMKTLI